MDNDKAIKDLAIKLQSLCDDKGIEIKPTKSAEIIHELGLLHLKQSPDKIGLIKSVGLLNAAIVRKPKNVSKIEEDLCKVCVHILEQANAQDQKADLIEKAKHVKSRFESMRSNTDLVLDLTENLLKFVRIRDSDLRSRQCHKILITKEIQLEITEQYKKIMQDLCQYCKNVMGPPPCKFAVVGMGSLSRKEITPYSDFEHIILLDIQKRNENNQEYFRWFSVIFHTIVLNLQETIIPTLNIKYLNDKTCDLDDWFFDNHTSGVSFDGMMPHACKFPLGRTQSKELIQPVDKMLEYLALKDSWKKDYHLSEILMSTCFVFGDETLHAEFEKGIQSYKEAKTEKERLGDIQKQVGEDLVKFATRTKLANLKPTDKLNVKQMFYRTSTLFIAALGKMCNVKSSSCFDIIEDLAEDKKISENAKHSLLHGVAIACEIRLRIYMKAKSQHDYIKPCADAHSIFDEILMVMDYKSIIKYFQITYCLQREIVRLLRIKGSYNYSKLSLLNITICWALKENELMLSLSKTFYEKDEYDSSEDGKSSSQSDSSSEECSRNKISINDSSDKSENGTSFSTTVTIVSESDAYSAITMNQSIFKDFERCLNTLEKEVEDHSFQVLIFGRNVLLRYLEKVAVAIHNINYDDALEFWKRIEEMRYSSADNTTTLSKKDKAEYDKGRATIHVIIADCLVEVKQFDNAAERLRNFENCIQVNNIDVSKITTFLVLAGSVWFKLKDFKKSFECLQNALGITISLDIEQDDEDGKYEKMVMLSGIGACLLHLDEHEESLGYLKRASETIEVQKIHEDGNFQFAFSLATCYHNLYKCSIKLNLLEEAFSHLRQAFEIATEGDSDEEDDEELLEFAKECTAEKRRAKELTGIFFDLGIYGIKNKEIKSGLNFLKRSLNLFEKLSAAENQSAAKQIFEPYTLQHTVVKQMIKLVK